MDSFYPKLDEVELVLVDDDNDFYDPLETNFECDDGNEDIKLQLNDTVYEESQFHWSDDETTNHSTKDVNNTIETVNAVVKQETSYEHCDYNYDNASDYGEKTVDSDENSSHSFEIRHESFENNDSNHSTEMPIIESKPDPNDIPQTDTELRKNQRKSDELEVKKVATKTEKPRNRKKRKKNVRKDVVTASTSECIIKKEPRIKKTLPKEEKV